MKAPKRRKPKDEEIDDLEDTRPVRFDALAELTSSEVVGQIKLGMSELTPLSGESEEDENSDEVAA
jgi:hypothetical protein